METIKENYVFKRAYSKGKKEAGKYVVVYSLRRKSGVRFGITVSKKIGKAVVRNRIRRVIRECLRYLAPAISDGQDVVIVARSAANYASFSDIFHALKLQMEKGGMLFDDEKAADYPYSIL